MTMSSRLRTNVPIGLSIAAGVLLSAQSAAAQVQSEKLQVQAYIGELCTVTSASLDFGQDVNVESVTNAEGSIDIHCATATSFAVALDGGLNYNGLSHVRQMTGTGGGSNLLYHLYKDPGRQNLWDAGDQVQVTIDGDDSVPVYGTVPTQSNGHAPGLHTDEVMITLVF